MLAWLLHIESNPDVHVITLVQSAQWHQSWRNIACWPGLHVKTKPDQHTGEPGQARPRRILGRAFPGAGRSAGRRLHRLLLRHRRLPGGRSPHPLAPGQPVALPARRLEQGAALRGDQEGVSAAQRYVPHQAASWPVGAQLIQCNVQGLACWGSDDICVTADLLQKVKLGYIPS